VTHVLIWRSGLKFVLNETPDQVDSAELAALKEHHLQEVLDVAGAYQVYALTVPPDKKLP
jgi:hypothetical protein